MAGLTGKKAKDTYKDLLQMENANAGLHATTMKAVCDGLGNPSIVKLSQAKMDIGTITDVEAALIALITTRLDQDLFSLDTDDFEGGASALGGTASGWVATVSGASAVAYSTQTPVTVAVTENFLGIVQVTAGAGATDSCRFHKGGTSVLLGLGHTIKQKWRVGVDALSDGTTTYICYVGYGDASSGNDTDAVCFRYTHSVNSGNWVGVCRSNGTESTVNLASGPAAGIMQILQIDINSDGTSVTFSVDGVAGTPVVANIPTGAGRQLGTNIRMTKSAGAVNARTCFGDWYWRLATRTTVR